MPGAKKKVDSSKLLSNAISLFAEKGFSAVTMTHIAKASGMTVSELRTKYETKEEILIAAFRVGHKRMDERLRTTTTGDLEAHLGEMFDACLDGLMPFGPEVHLNILLQATRDKTLMEIVRRTSRNVNFAVKAYISQMVSMSIIDEVEEVEKVNEDMVASLVEGVTGVLDGKKLSDIKKTWVAQSMGLFRPCSKTAIHPVA